MGLLVLQHVAVHFVDTNFDSLDAPEVDEVRVTLNFTGVVIVFGTGNGEIPISGGHDESSKGNVHDVHLADNAINVIVFICSSWEKVSHIQERTNIIITIIIIIM